ncbi:hypothetical protein GGX14DRAFT_309365, partial [Mycena pura]
CQQHIAEAKVLPQARLLNWPEAIVYVELRSRVQTFLQELLEPLLEDPTSSTFFAEAEARRAQGVCSQFHPPTAYFGYIGYQQILLAAQDYFNKLKRSEELDLTAVQPLTPDEFVLEVVVPEAQAALIMDD